MHGDLETVTEIDVNDLSRASLEQEVGRVTIS